MKNKIKKIILETTIISLVLAILNYIIYVINNNINLSAIIIILIITYPICRALK